MPQGGVGHYVGAGRIARADHADCDAQVAEIVAYHERKGYRRGGAYNEHVCQHGGRWLHYLGANQASGDTWANLNLHAVCALIGDGDTPTPALLTAMHEAWRDAGALAWITPHSYWFATSCCGDPLRDWISAGALAPASAITPPPQEDEMRLIKVQETEEWVLVTPLGYERNITGDRVWAYASAGIPSGTMPGAYVDAFLNSVMAMRDDVVRRVASSVPASGGSVPQKWAITGLAVPAK